MFKPDFLHTLVIYGPVILFSLTVHEFFHAWTAYRLGDSTAARLGRMSLNPLVHLDLYGTIFMVVSGFRIGWAKPVPVNLLNLRNPRRDDIWISAAGPLSNFGIAIIASMVFRLGEWPPVAQELLFAAVTINVGLALFNLLPLFPLDGSHIVRNMLPQQLAAAYDSFEQFAPWILIILMVTGLFWVVVGPIFDFIVAILLGS